jgi:hypothetical protein
MVRMEKGKLEVQFDDVAGLILLASHLVFILQEVCFSLGLSGCFSLSRFSSISYFFPYNSKSQLNMLLFVPCFILQVLAKLISLVLYDLICSFYSFYF